MLIDDYDCSVQHTAPDICVAISQTFGREEGEEWFYLVVGQVLSDLAEGDGYTATRLPRVWQSLGDDTAKRIQDCWRNLEQYTEKQFRDSDYDLEFRL